MLKVALLTLGCRVNQSESTVLEGTLKKNGICLVSLEENPDYCIVNTCTVTAKSDYNSRQLIRRAARAGAKVIVTGCYSEMKAEAVGAIPGVIEVVKSEKKYEIPGMITSAPSAPFFGYQGRSRPYLKVQDGCNHHCSYCAVPMARGKSRSVPPSEVLDRARILESSGCKEIVLTGIHLGAYGHDLADKTHLCYLLKILLTGTAIHRIRLSSLEVTEIDHELLELLQEPRICNHLHLPLQSGSDNILRKMRRSYTSTTYRRQVERIAAKIYNIAIGTDIIAGFPGEEERDFAETCSLVENLPFSYFHIFPFSPRPGTDAALMKGTPRDIRRRLDKLRALHAGKKFKYMSAQLNGKLEVIIEESIDGGLVRGTSANYLKISAPALGKNIGTVAAVRPQEIVNGMLRGSIIAQP